MLLPRIVDVGVVLSRIAVLVVLVVPLVAAVDITIVGQRFLVTQTLAIDDAFSSIEVKDTVFQSAANLVIGGQMLGPGRSIVVSNCTFDEGCLHVDVLKTELGSQIRLSQLAFAATVAAAGVKLGRNPTTVSSEMKGTTIEVEHVRLRRQNTMQWFNLVLLNCTVNITNITSSGGELGPTSLLYFGFVVAVDSVLVFRELDVGSSRDTLYFDRAEFNRSSAITAASSMCGISVVNSRVAVLHSAESPDAVSFRIYSSRFANGCRIVVSNTSIVANRTSRGLVSAVKVERSSFTYSTLIVSQSSISCSGWSPSGMHVDAMTELNSRSQLILEQTRILLSTNSSVGQAVDLFVTVDNSSVIIRRNNFSLINSGTSGVTAMAIRMASTATLVGHHPNLVIGVNRVETESETPSQGTFTAFGIFPLVQPGCTEAQVDVRDNSLHMRGARTMEGISFGSVAFNATATWDVRGNDIRFQEEHDIQPVTDTVGIKWGRTGYVAFSGGENTSLLPADKALTQDYYLRQVSILNNDIYVHARIGTGILLMGAAIQGVELLVDGNRVTQSRLWSTQEDYGIFVSNMVLGYDLGKAVYPRPLPGLFYSPSSLQINGNIISGTSNQIRATLCQIFGSGAPRGRLRIINNTIFGYSGAGISLDYADMHQSAQGEIAHNRVIHPPAAAQAARGIRCVSTEISNNSSLVFEDNLIVYNVTNSSLAVETSIYYWGFLLNSITLREGSRIVVQDLDVRCSGYDEMHPVMVVNSRVSNNSAIEFRRGVVEVVQLYHPQLTKEMVGFDIRNTAAFNNSHVLLEHIAVRAVNLGAGGTFFGLYMIYGNADTDSEIVVQRCSFEVSSRHPSVHVSWIQLSIITTRSEFVVDTSTFRFLVPSSQLRADDDAFPYIQQRAAEVLSLGATRTHAEAMRLSQVQAQGNSTIRISDSLLDARNSTTSNVAIYCHTCVFGTSLDAISGGRLHIVGNTLRTFVTGSTPQSTSFTILLIGPQCENALIVMEDNDIVAQGQAGYLHALRVTASAVVAQQRVNMWQLRRNRMVLFAAQTTSADGCASFPSTAAQPNANVTTPYDSAPVQVLALSENSCLMVFPSPPRNAAFPSQLPFITGSLQSRFVQTQLRCNHIAWVNGTRSANFESFEPALAPFTWQDVRKESIDDTDVASNTLSVVETSCSQCSAIFECHGAHPSLSATAQPYRGKASKNVFPAKLWYRQENRCECDCSIPAASSWYAPNPCGVELWQSSRTPTTKFADGADTQSSTYSFSRTPDQRHPVVSFTGSTTIIATATRLRTRAESLPIPTPLLRNRTSTTSPSISNALPLNSGVDGTALSASPRSSRTKTIGTNLESVIASRTRHEAVRDEADDLSSATVSAVAVVLSPAAAKAVVATGVTSAAATGLLSPTASSQSVRVGSVAAVIQCSFSDVSTTPSYFEHPVRMCLGRSDLCSYVGSALMTTVLFILIPIVLLGVGVWLRRGVPQDSPKYRFLVERLCSTAVALTQSYFTAGIIKAVILVLAHPDPNGSESRVVDVAVLTCCLVFLLVVVAAEVYLVFRKLPCAIEVAVDSERNKVSVEPSAVGRTSMRGLPEAAYMFIDAAKAPNIGKYRMFFFEDLVVTCTLGALDGVRPSSGDCSWVAGLMLVVCTFHLGYLLVVRPYRAKLEMAFVALTSTVLLLIALLAVIITVSDEASSVATTATKVLGTLAIIESGLFFAQMFVLGGWMYFVTERRRVRKLQQSAELEMGTKTPLSESDNNDIPLLQVDSLAVAPEASTSNPLLK